MEQICAVPRILGRHSPALQSTCRSEQLRYWRPGLRIPPLPGRGKALGPNRKPEVYNQRPSSIVGQGSATTLLYEGLEVPLPNHLPNRRRAQQPNTYAPPEGTSLGEPAQGLKEGGKQAHDLTEPGLHRPETDREDALLPFRPER